MDFDTLLNTIGDIQSKPNKVQEIFKEIGLDCWTYQNLNLPDSIETSFPTAWVNRYISKKYSRVDPIAAIPEAINTPVFWKIHHDSYSLISPNLNKESIKIPEDDKNRINYLKDAKDYNISSGLLIPINSIGDCSSYSFLDNNQLDQNWKENNLKLLESICNIDFQLNRPKFKDIGEITNREKEVILWLAEGKNSWEMSKILNISERTVSFHIGNIKEKMRVNNRVQIITEAFRRKIIK